MKNTEQLNIILAQLEKIMAFDIAVKTHQHSEYFHKVIKSKFKDITCNTFLKFREIDVVFNNIRLAVCMVCFTIVIKINLLLYLCGHFQVMYPSSRHRDITTSLCRPSWSISLDVQCTVSSTKKPPPPPLAQKIKIPYEH